MNLNELKTYLISLDRESYKLSYDVLYSFRWPAECLYWGLDYLIHALI